MDNCNLAWNIHYKEKSVFNKKPRNMDKILISLEKLKEKIDLEK